MSSFAQAQAAYDPNNIIRDDTFTNSTTMDQAAIQSFLAQKGSCLATVDPSLLGTGGLSAAAIIASAAQSANGGQGINPQVLLVTMQKEWSLVTKSCADLEALYGGYDGGPNVYLKRGLGYDVPDVLGIGSCLYTFDAQLRGAMCSGNHYFGAPDSMRAAYSNNQVGPGGTYAFPTPFVVQQYSDQVGNITITPRTKSTAVLYRYTPYAYYGNYNFYNLFSGWFGNPACPPNLGIIKSTTSPTYAIKDSIKYPVNSLDTLFAWGMDCLSVDTVSDDVLNTYPTGAPITRVIKSVDSSSIYVVANGARRHIRTSLYVTQLGLDSEPVSELPSSVVNAIPEGAPLGYLVKAPNDDKIYLAQATTKIYIPDVPTVAAWGFDLSELIILDSTYINALPTIATLSMLVKGSAPEIYVATNHQFFWIPSLQRVQDWAMQNFSVTVVDDQFLNSLPKAGQLTKLTRGSGDPIYYIDKGKRYHITSLATAQRYLKNYGPLTPMSDILIGRIPTGPDIK